MKIEYTRRFEKFYRALPAHIQDRADRVLDYLLTNPSHPSLEHKKMEGYEDIWEIRVNMNYRITYQKIGDTAFLRKIGTHNLLQSP